MVLLGGGKEIKRLKRRRSSPAKVEDRAVRMEQRVEREVIVLANYSEAKKLKDDKAKKLKVTLFVLFVFPFLFFSSFFLLCVCVCVFCYHDPR